jgi:hypothetical protein
MSNGQQVKCQAPLIQETEINKSRIVIGDDLEEVESSEEIEEGYEHPIGKVITCFIHRILDIEECAQDYIFQAVTKYNDKVDRIRSEVIKYRAHVGSGGDRDNSLAAVRELRKLMRETERHNKSSPVETIERSLFVNLFASLDKFTGDLVQALYATNQDLYKNINREITLSEALKFDSLEGLKLSMLDKEIETLRRKGYIDQFTDLEKKFAIKLTRFDKFPDFVECSQRRNLFTHCDGIVSRQYLDVCIENNYKFKKPPEIGDQLRIGGVYLFNTCSTVTEVAVMLGQTLWRKTNPDGLEEADSHLNSLIFDFLHMEEWDKAISLSKFALGLPSNSGERVVRMFHVNYAIALKAKGEAKAAKSVMDKLDWSATAYEFKIAYEVLCDNFVEAKKTMLKIGANGDLITEMTYHDWPVFREFRETTEFFESYEEVFGYKYATKLSSLAEGQSLEVLDQDGSLETEQSPRQLTQDELA